MKVLIITYNFPPEVIGVRRVLKWIDYFPENGIEPLILTVKDVVSPHYDTKPLEEINKRKITVCRSGSLDPYRLMKIYKDLFGKSGAAISSGENTEKNPPSISNPPAGKRIMDMLRKWLFIPDDRMGWIPFAFYYGAELIKAERPHLIISTSFPNSAHIVGMLLKTYSKIPWIADFRDGWSQNPTFFSYATPLHEKISASLEKSVVKNADAVVTVSPPITEYLKKLCPEKPEKFHTIYNGYDPADFKNDLPEQTNEIQSEKDKFRIIYTGTVFGNRSPLNIFKALEAAVTESEIPAGEIEFVFYTSMPGEFMDYIKNSRIAGNVVIKSFLPYKECLDIQKKSDALLLFLPREKNTEIMVTQKVFEYLGAEKPILAVIPEGACKEVLVKTGGAVFADPDDIQEIRRSIVKLYNDWKNKTEIKPSKEIVESFTRSNQTKLLADIMRGLIKI